MRSNEIFGRTWEEMQKRNDNLRQKAIVAVAVGWLVSLGILGGLAYVAVHLLGKVW